MANLDLSKPVLGFVPCIEFRWGLDNVVRYCRADSNHVFNGESYVGVPALDIEFQMQDGGTKVKPVILSCPIDLHPVDKLVTQTFAELEVTILEADFSAPDDLPRIAYKGQIFKTKARFRGKAKLVRVEIFGHKHFLTDVSLGIKCTDRCPWFFGDHVCGATVPFDDAVVETVSGTTLVLTTLANDVAGYGGNGWYTRGYAEYDGLRLMIRKHKATQRKLILAKAPPQMTGYTCLGQTVRIFAGCDKSVEACTGWGRQLRFGGYGRVMPPYNPLIENPG